MLQILVALVSLFLIFVVLLDAFETIILPRRVTQRYRLTTLFYFFSWRPWSALGRRIKSSGRRETFLSFYGPLSLILLLVTWTVVLIVGFAGLQWASGARMTTGIESFGTLLYQSGVTFLTLGYGDVAPTTAAGRTLAVLEAGTGFGFLALVIGYLPVFYGSFSRREVNVSLLDGQAGSPPTASELLRRYGEDGNAAAVNEVLHEWERWSAELLESHISYPALAYFRSQHENQSWVAALTMILDACTLIIVGIEGIPVRQARLTFAIARHAAVDLAQIFSTAPRLSNVARLTPDILTRLRAELTDAGLQPHTEFLDNLRLAELRAMYEPYVFSLASHLLLDLPPWVPLPNATDNWQTTAWGQAESLPVDPVQQPQPDLSIRRRSRVAVED